MEKLEPSSPNGGTGGRTDAGMGEDKRGEPIIVDDGEY
jgi:hypothetical protein